MMQNTEKTMDKVIALCKNRGFVYAGSEIYGGLANSWDYGPLSFFVVSCYNILCIVMYKIYRERYLFITYAAFEKL